MDFENIAGRQKQVFIKHGYRYTRKGYEIRVEVADKFAKKCNRLGDPEGRIVEKLIEAFNNTTGWGQDVKAAPFFETDSLEHIKEASQIVNEKYKGLY